MNVGYLVNVYLPSLSFVRRELLAHEAAGLQVQRYVLRRYVGPLPDEQDQREHALSREVLGVGALGLLIAIVLTCFTKPGRFIATLGDAVREGRRSDRGLLRHLICFAEACVLSRWLKRDGITHLHAHFGTNTAAVACMTSALSGISYSFTVHGPEEFDRAPGLGLGHKIARARFVVAISEFGRGQLMRWCASEHWPKIKVVRCGLDARFLRSDSVPVPDNTRVVCVGRLVEQKAQLVLVEAAAILKSRGIPIEVRLIGGGEMQPQIEAAVARHELRDQVKLLGWLSAADVQREMNEARLIAQPSLAEGLPVALMEALALSRPVVTTRIAGIPELIDGQVGWVVSPGSAEELATALSDALAMPTSKLDEMGRIGRQRVLLRHDIAVEAERLRMLFGGARNVG